MGEQMKQIDERKTEGGGIRLLIREKIPTLIKMVIPKSRIREDNEGGIIDGAEERISRHDEKTPYLEVIGRICPKDSEAPDIQWKILLPFQWNGRSVQIGGGANNGRIPDLEGEMILSRCCPIEHGYAVFGDDSGHQSEDPMSAEFASNEEALQNYIRSRTQV